MFSRGNRNTRTNRCGSSFSSGSRNCGCVLFVIFGGVLVFNLVKGLILGQLQKSIRDSINKEFEWGIERRWLIFDKDNGKTINCIPNRATELEIVMLCKNECTITFENHCSTGKYPNEARKDVFAFRSADDTSNFTIELIEYEFDDYGFDTLKIADTMYTHTKGSL